MFDTSQPAYLRFRNIYAERTSSVLAWVGSGLSAPARLPTWPALKRLLIEEARAKFSLLKPEERKERFDRLATLDTIKDHWVVFEHLRKILGETSYQAAIRQNLSIKTGTVTPKNYEMLWRLRIAGILNLNIDRFASKAFAEVRTRDLLHEFSGYEVKNYLHLLKTDVPIIANLHGIVENYSSWVFTKAELKKLIESESYKIFINSILATKTVIFIGISADDTASGGFVGRLKELGIDCGGHYWITSRQDADTDKWAETNGLQVIRYTAVDEDHSELDEFFADLTKYLPRDSSAPPVHSTRTPISYSSIPALSSPSELATKDPETIRKTLNSYAGKILRDSSELSIKQYEQFCKEYRRAIWNAWFVELQEPENTIFGYKVIGQVGEGAFGRVYIAQSKDGLSKVAVKLLKHEVLDNPNMLGSFRRGVRSMQILSENNVPGMVPYQEAYELPACIVMEYIEGPNLEKAVESGHLDWLDKLRISREIVKIIRSGHLLPQRVLHRDIRPANIMLKGFYSSKPTNAWEVVILDFDLSWHRDALERSIDISASAALGYIAPEQIQDIPGVSTRNALVDSFGIGMSLYFMFGGVHPRPGDNQRDDWLEKINNRISDITPAWLSAPARLSRLIWRATHFEQHKRIDANQLEMEIDRITKCVSTPASILYADMLAEEILCRAFSAKEYIWDADHGVGEKQLASGIRINLRGDEIQKKILCQIGWAFSGDDERRKVDKYLPKAVDQTIAQLKQGGWSIENRNTVDRTVMINASVSTSSLYKKIDEIARALVTSAEKLRF